MCASACWFSDVPWKRKKGRISTIEQLNLLPKTLMCLALVAGATAPGKCQHFVCILWNDNERIISTDSTMPGCKSQLNPHMRQVEIKPAYLTLEYFDLAKSSLHLCKAESILCSEYKLILKLIWRALANSAFLFSFSNPPLHILLCHSGAFCILCRLCWAFV